MERRLCRTVRGLCKVASERSCGEEAEGDPRTLTCCSQERTTLLLLLLETSYCVPTPETSQESRRALFTCSGAHSRLEVLWKCGVNSVGPGWLRVCVSNKAVIPWGLVGDSREEVTWRGVGCGGRLGV